MRLILDGKSVAVGLFAGAALVASLGAMQRDAPQVGRFQIAAGERGYVVDTATGRVWMEHMLAGTRGDFIGTKMNDDWK